MTEDITKTEFEGLVQIVNGEDDLSGYLVVCPKYYLQDDLLRALTIVCNGECAGDNECPYEKDIIIFDGKQYELKMYE